MRLPITFKNTPREPDCACLRRQAGRPSLTLREWRRSDPSGPLGSTSQESLWATSEEQMRRATFVIALYYDLLKKGRREELTDHLLDLLASTYAISELDLNRHQLARLKRNIRRKVER